MKVDRRWRTQGQRPPVESFIRPGAVLPAAFLLGLALRCLDVESHELQYDEAATGYFSALPWPELWGGPASLEPNPPLFYSLAWLVTRAGGSVEQIRYISVVAGALCIPLAWLIARDLAGDFAAAGAALLAAMSPQHIAVSQYARAYALLILCLMGAFFCLLRARRSLFAPPQKDRAGKVWWWSGYVVLGAASLYTHHTAIVVLAALNVALLVVFVRADAASGRFLKESLVANLVLAGLYAPWLPVLVSQVNSPGATLPARRIQFAVPQRLWNTVTNPHPFGGLPWIDVRLLPVILIGACRFRLSREGAFLAAFVLGGLVLMLVASQFRPLIDGKTLAWAGLFATVATAIGCSASGRFRLPLLLLVALLELRADVTALDPTPEGWREVAAILREDANPRDMLYVNYAASLLPLRHYGWSGAGINVNVFAKANEEPWFRGHVWPIVAPQAVAGEALRESCEGKRVWLLNYGNTRPDEITNEIAANAIRAVHRRTEKLDLSLFLPSAPAPAAPDVSR